MFSIRGTWFLEGEPKCYSFVNISHFAGGMLHGHERLGTGLPFHELLSEQGEQAECVSIFIRETLPTRWARILVNERSVNERSVKECGGQDLRM